MATTTVRARAKHGALLIDDWAEPAQTGNGASGEDNGPSVSSSFPLRVGERMRRSGRGALAAADYRLLQPSTTPWVILGRIAPRS